MKKRHVPVLYEKLKDTIRADIEAGRIAPGDRILSERLLAEKHGVSRITVKKAVADLVLEGFLEHLPRRRGTFVKRRECKPGSPRFIAVAIDDVRDSFGAEMLRGIEDFLWDKRIHTLICNADRDFAKVEEYFRSLLAHHISGVIFAPVIDYDYVAANRKLVAILEKARIPFTLIDRYIPGMLTNYVGANHEESSRTITRYLLDQGHRRILIARGLECTSMDDRVAGYRHAHEEAGVELDERLIAAVNDNLLDREPDAEEMRRLETIIRQAGAFSCFYGLNDRLLHAGTSIMLAMGIEVGGAVALASHDKVAQPWLPYMHGMPHFREPTYEMGWEAARVLVEHIMEPDRAIVQMVLKSKFVPPP